MMGVYEELGVVPIINATGSVTRLGGSLMPESVLAAFRSAAGESVALEELQIAASKIIAELTETEAGLVTAGASAALTLGTAAILAGDDLGKMQKLPDCAGIAREFLIAREHRNGYDHAVRAAGAKLVDVGMNEVVSGAGVRRCEIWEYAAEITPETVGILYVLTEGSQPALEEIVSLARQHGLRVLVDAAAELPPRSNLKAVPASGADLVAFSGGKAIRGPQSTGILCGNSNLIESARLQMLDMDDHPKLWQPPADWATGNKVGGIPRHGIGRGYKVSKEEIVALLTALKLFATGTYDREIPVFLSWLKRIEDGIKPWAKGVILHDKGDGESFPQLEIKIDEAGLGKTAFEICRALRAGSPRIFVGHSLLPAGSLLIHPLALKESHIEPIISRLRDELA